MTYRKLALGFLLKPRSHQARRDALTGVDTRKRALTLPKIKQIIFRRDATRSMWTHTIFSIS